ncbi:hypothetical protein FB45DRAFT_273697 [Roridomyces roridus]|uniref:Secreted protein n=1 Tax=Roridomyces roridus TaxID=1738132 RepID=A0AAD7FB21_9AGAR|nr:hypothetical protein FB45DRAFT_273697 [Roridomyces roridus]
MRMILGMIVAFAFFDGSCSGYSTTGIYAAWTIPAAKTHQRHGHKPMTRLTRPQPLEFHSKTDEIQDDMKISPSGSPSGLPLTVIMDSTPKDTKRRRRTNGSCEGYKRRKIRCR